MFCGYFSTEFLFFTIDCAKIIMLTYKLNDYIIGNIYDVFILNYL